VGILWFAAHNLSGFGAHGSAMYVDPGADPLRFLGVLVERGPILLWGQWAWPPAHLHFLLSAGGQRALWWMAIALAVFLFAALLPIQRRHAQARFLALGMVLALVPAATTFPSGRLLLFAGVGAGGLLALLLARLLTIVRDRTAQALPRRLYSASWPSSTWLGQRSRSRHCWERSSGSSAACAPWLPACPATPRSRIRT